jgi:hypothetical protein
VLEDRQLHQLDEPRVPLIAGGYIEVRARQRVLGGDPSGDVGIVAVLEPALRIGDVDAVERVDDVLTPGRRDGGRDAHRVADGSVRSAPAEVGALAVVRLGAAQAGLALLGLLGHRRTRLTASPPGQTWDFVGPALSAENSVDRPAPAS